MDEKDKKILEILQENNNLSTRDIAKRTRIPITTIFKRIKKLKQNKVIKRFTVELDHAQLGKNLSAYILVSADIRSLKEKNKTQYDVASHLRKIEGIDKVDIVTGKTDLIVHIRTKNVQELDAILLGKIQGVHGVSNTQTLIVIHEDE